MIENKVKSKFYPLMASGPFNTLQGEVPAPLVDIARAELERRIRERLDTDGAMFIMRCATTMSKHEHLDALSRCLADAVLNGN